MSDCNHKNKKITDGYNYDMEVYYECPDCGDGWRQKPDLKDLEDVERISDECDKLDAEALGIDLNSIKK